MKWRSRHIFDNISRMRKINYLIPQIPHLPLLSEPFFSGTSADGHTSLLLWENLDTQRKSKRKIYKCCKYHTIISPNTTELMM